MTVVRKIGSPKDLISVLLIEPYHRYRLFIESALEDSEFDLVLATNPDEASQVIRGMNLQMILAEDNIPGYDTARCLLELREGGLECPIILMSTNGSPENIRKYACLSLSDFLIKPIDEARLLTSLRVALNPSKKFESLLSQVQGRGLARVLIADDIGATRRMLSNHLKNAGYTPVEASGGIETINQVEAGGIDVLLLDYQMRDMNGLEVLQELRMRGKTLPTIMISAHATPEIISKSRIFGAVDFFEKPIDFPTLISRLKSIVGHGKGETAQRNKILIVEDDSQMRTLVVRALEHLEVDILEASDGYEARTELQFSNIQLVILDMNLPGIDGQQLLREIEEAGGTMKVIIISGFITKEDKADLMEKPFVSGVFRKPIDMNEFRRSVSAALPATTTNSA